MNNDPAFTGFSAFRQNELQPRKLPRSIRWIKGVVLCSICVAVLAVAVHGQELSSDSLRLKLNVTSEGVPVIQKATWQKTGKTVFRDMGTPEGLSEWAPPGLIPEVRTAPVWNITEGNDFKVGEATCELANKVFMTWIVELPKQGQLFRLHIRLTNLGNRARTIDSFPAWLASWDVAGQSEWARWWRSIKYKRVEEALNAATRIQLGSLLYSSDNEDGGSNPYWVIGGSDSRIYFGLEWCGGWSAKLLRAGDGFKFSVGLPAEETQLLLGQGESVEGPALLVTPTTGPDDGDHRATWMRRRVSLGQMLYSGPPLQFPLTYNHWYAVRRNVDSTFVNRQIAAMPPYSFDAFIIDAGWFAEGRWKPDPEKFQPSEFKQMLASLKDSGVRPGLWSAPQYLSPTNNESGLTIEEPLVLSDYVDGYLVDVSQEGFSRYLTEHTQMLRSRYSVDYWKYDQPFFTGESRSGQMKHVIGFQNAMRSVRQANPDLMIENCLYGGRMINEFTLLAAQATWLSDLGSSGMPDPLGNVSVALNAMDFIFPWAALRFTINLDRLDPDDDEMLRLYCRSAMAGMWGISTDLSTITVRQQNTLLKEIENYRRLNDLKFACLYDLLLPNDTADATGVTFYSDTRHNAGVLLYRWGRNGRFEQHVDLSKLESSMTYRVVDVDKGTEIIVSGSVLISNGITVPFNPRRLSALLFIEPVIESQTQPEP